MNRGAANLRAGTRLFDGVRTDVDLIPREVRHEPEVTHLVYESGERDEQ